MSLPLTRETVYQALLNKEDDADTEQLAVRPQYESRASWASRFARRITVIPLWLAVCFGILQATCISLLIGYRLSDHCGHPNAQILYSPAQDVIEYEVVKFNSGLLGGEAPDIYSLPPSDEVDKAWSDLYNFGISEIPEDQAGRLVNATSKIAHSDSKYIVGIDVFHQLHCLNLVRKALHPSYYPQDVDPIAAEQREIHLAHCINILRQSLQCSADISTIVYNKPVGRKQSPRFDILHSCRNFEKIKEWGMNHRAHTYRDAEEMPDDLGHL